MFVLDTANEVSTKRTGLVLEKISRPRAKVGVSRPRLLSILNKGLASCTSTIISGRAGTGKTALAIDFSINCQRPTCWYKIDAPESDLKIFFQYLIASIQEHRPTFGNRTLKSLIANAELEDMPLLAEVFVHELLENEGGPLLIVIEDLHLVCDAEWLVPLFRRLLPLLPSEVHLLITSRTLPPAPLWRMRSKQTLLVLDENALAFTRSEARELFASYGLSNEAASIALDHTYGRIAALAAFAQNLRESKGELFNVIRTREA
jgi:LuxR family maltose regulon positive regulatory protein